MSTTLERLEYGFDRDSRRTWRRRALAVGEDDAYGYDGLSQVINAARGNLNLNETAIGGVPAADEAWDYDPTGNWRGYQTAANGLSTLDQRRVHDRGNRLMQVEGPPETVRVDRAGRMRQVPPDASADWNNSMELKWDAWSRLVEVRQGEDVLGSYAYDGLTRRTTRTTGDATLHCYYSDAWRPLEERRLAEEAATCQYFWGARHRDDLVRRDRDPAGGTTQSETRYVLMDYFNPAAITDASGNVTERYAFTAFGVRRIMAPDFTPRTDSECAWDFGFQGQFLDSESGFYDYGYRYYSPSVGRWMCKDPISEEGGVNLYGFAANDGVNTVDLLGLEEANKYKCCKDDLINEGWARIQKTWKELFGRYKSGGIKVDENSCHGWNSLFNTLLPHPPCWECHLHHKMKKKEIEEVSKWRLLLLGYGDHWVIICRAFGMDGKVAREELLDATGGYTGRVAAFEKDYPFAGEDDNIAPPAVPCGIKIPDPVLPPYDWARDLIKASSYPH